MDRRAFSHDDLSVYERISPDDFPCYDEVDSCDILERGAPGCNLEPVYVDDDVDGD